MNKTFEDLQILQELNDAWREVGPRIKNYMESSVEIQLLQVRLKMFYLCLKKKVSFDIPSPFFVLSFLCVSEFVKEAGGGSSGQPSSGKHILDSLTDRTFPVNTLA